MKCPGPEGGSCTLRLDKPDGKETCRHCRCGFPGCTKPRVNLKKACKTHEGQVE